MNKNINIQTKIDKYYFLVVDDNAFTCKLFANMLRTLGASRVDMADDGSSAINLIESTERSPDIIMCDLNMPELNGVELLEYLAKKQFTGGIILISATDIKVFNGVKNLAKAYKLNLLGAISKPPAISEIAEILLNFTGAPTL